MDDRHIGSVGADGCTGDSSILVWPVLISNITYARRISVATLPSIVGRLLAAIIESRRGRPLAEYSVSVSAPVEVHGDGFPDLLVRITPAPPSCDWRPTLPAMSIFDRTGRIWETGSKAFGAALRVQHDQSGLWRSLAPGIVGDCFFDLIPPSEEQGARFERRQPEPAERPIIIFRNAIPTAVREVP
jgi:hypothetical protein